MFKELEKCFYYYENIKDRDVKSRYFDKIQLCYGVDPYKLSKRDLSMDPSDCPRMSFDDLFNYVINSKSSYTDESFNANKALGSKDFLKAGWIQEIRVKRLQHIQSTIVIGQVHHSFKINENDLVPWVLCHDDGEVICAHCTCVAGMGEVCSHVGALLYAIVSTNDSTNPTSCTEIPCKWKIPTPVKKLSFQTISEINWKKSSRTAKSLDRNVQTNVEPNVEVEVNLVERKLTKEFNVMKLLEDFEKAGCKSAMASVTLPYASRYASKEVELDPIATESQYSDEEELAVALNLSIAPEIVDQMLAYDLRHMFNSSYSHKSLQELQFIAESVNLFIEENYILDIEKFTRDQSSSKLWKSLRAGRITASNFKAACITKIENPAKSTIIKICCPIEFNSRPTQYGKENENKALEDFINHFKTEHAYVQVRQCGLILSNEFPGFGASPDGVISCSCHGESIIEIKCPFSWKDGGGIDKLLDMRDPFLLQEGNTIAINKKHSYFYQIQMQLFLSKKELCHLVVWNKFQMFVMEVLPDQSFWDGHSTEAFNFHKSIILPELLGKFFLK